VDDIVQVRQIAQYPLVATTAPTDVALLQQVGVGGPYVSILTKNLVGSTLALLASLKLAAGTTIAWNGASLSSNGVGFTFSGDVQVPSMHSTGDIFVAGNALATQVNVDALFDSILENSVWTVNGRNGNVILQTSDILQAGAAPIQDAHFGGFNTSPTPWDFRANSDQIATTAFVQNVIEQLICGGSIVASFNGRGGDVILTTADVNAAFAVPGPPFPTAANPALGDSSNRIATTLFVDESIQDAIAEAVFIPDLALYAPLHSPAFTGLPTAPTANVGTSTGQLATTAFVQAAVTASTTGVSSFNTRTGAVTLTAADLAAAGGAPLASPNFTGIPMAPTATVGTSTQQLATTAFVLNEIGAIAAGVATFNGRSGNVTLTTADVTGAGGAPIASPTFTGVPAGPTAAAATNTTQLATTAFVLANSVLSFNGRQGAVTLTNNDVTAAGGAVVNSPAFTGVPTAPTAAVNTNTTQLATTAFVLAQLATAGGVTTWNGRAGAVTLTAADITGAGGALLAGPAFSGVPTAPTAAPGTNTTQLATTAFAAALVATPPSGSRVQLARQDVTSATAAVTFLNAFSTTYEQYELVCLDMLAAADNVALLLSVTSDGTTWGTATSYQYSSFWTLSNATSGVSGTGTAAWISLGNIGATSSVSNHAWVKIPFPSLAGAAKYIDWTAVYHLSNGAYSYNGTGAYSVSPYPAITGLRLQLAGPTNFLRGTFILYGIVK
jgi:hypothetical protein